MEEESKQEFALHQSFHRHSHGLLPQHHPPPPPHQILQFSPPSHHHHHHIPSHHIPPPPFSSFADPSPLLPFNNVLNGSPNVQNSLSSSFHGGLNPPNSPHSSFHGGSNVQNYLSGSFHGAFSVQNSISDLQNSSFIPLAGMANSMQQDLASPQMFSQQQTGQTRLLAHDFLKPHRSFPLPVSAAAAATAAALSTETKQNQNSEAGYENHLVQKERDISSKDLLTKVCMMSRKTREKLEQEADSQAPAVSSSSSKLYGSPKINLLQVPAMANRHDEAAMVSSTDLCLQNNTAISAQMELAPSATSLLLHESSAVSIAPRGVQMRELSSFQNITLCSSWSPMDQVLDNRKRPWSSTQEHEFHTEAIKGVDLNASADDIQSESTEQDTCVSVPSIIRDSWNLSPTITRKLMMREEQNNSKMISMSNSCNECSTKGGEKCRTMMETSDMLVDITGFLSLRKTTLKYDMRDAGLGAPDFLTLGPICSIQELGSIPSQNGNTDVGSITRKPTDHAANHMHQKASQNQTNGVEEVIFMPEATVGLLEKCQTKPEFTDKIAWRVEDQCSSFLPQSQTEEYLDLELRLSI